MLDLFNNQLSGSIPSELGDLSNLEWLRLFNNKLTGSIPPELGKLTKLRSLFLTGNNFNEDSCIPAALRDVAENDLDEIGLSFCDGEATPTPTPTATPVTVQVPEEVLNRISRLETLVATLQGLIATLQSAITTLDGRVTALETNASVPTPIPTATFTPTPTFEPGVPTPVPTETPVPTATSVPNTCVTPITEDGVITASWINTCQSTNRPKDPDADDGTYYARYYTFDITTPSTVTITLASSSEDTFLYLLNGKGKTGSVAHSNDDIEFRVNSNSQIEETLQVGSYTIEAATYDSGTVGSSFTLTVSGIQ